MAGSQDRGIKSRSLGILRRGGGLSCPSCSTAQIPISQENIERGAGQFIDTPLPRCFDLFLVIPQEVPNILRNERSVDVQNLTEVTSQGCLGGDDLIQFIFDKKDL